MSDDLTTADVLVEIQQAFHRIFKRIYDSVIVPMTRWFKQHRKLLLALGIPWPRRRPRNSRVRAVQAKRARLLLPPSGKYADISRKASYALAAHVRVDE